MTDQTTPVKSAARTAAEWWAKAIGAPTYRMVDDRSTGEERRAADLTSVMAHMLAEANPVTEESGSKFADELEQRISAMTYSWRVLDVDYGPDEVLASAARAAGVSTSRFPWKTTMWIADDKVTVRNGYGAEIQVVWTADGAA